MPTTCSTGKTDIFNLANFVRQRIQNSDVQFQRKAVKLSHWGSECLAFLLYKYMFLLLMFCQSTDCFSSSKNSKLKAKHFAYSY